MLHALWNIVAERRRRRFARSAFISAAQLSLIWAPLAMGGWAVAAAGAGARVVAVAASAGAHRAVTSPRRLRGYRLADLTVVYPVARGTGAAAGSASGAVLLLGERLTAFGGLGGWWWAAYS